MAQAEYLAIFSIGAKLLGSFGGAFAKAGQTMQKLGKTALNAVKWFGKVTGAAALLGSALAAFGVGAVFAKLFAGADKAAKAAMERTQRLTAILGSHPQLQKLGTAAIEGQVKAIQKVTSELGKQGVVSGGLYQDAAATLALLGLSPKVIAGMLPVLGDVLVATKGVNATQEDMQGLVNGINKAIGSGQTKALADVGIFLDKNQKKEFAAMTQTQRRTYLMDTLAQKYAGVNAEAAKTDIGKLKVFDNTLAGISKRIGDEMIPAQAKLAEFWTTVLPEIEPIAKNVFKGIASAMGDTAKIAQEQVVPAIRSVKDYLFGVKEPVDLSQLPSHMQGVVEVTKDTGPSEFAKNMGELGNAFKELGTALTPVGNALKDLASAFGIAIPPGQNFGQLFTGAVTGLIKDFAATISGLATVITKLDDGFKQAVASLGPFWDKLKEMPVVGPYLQEVENRFKEFGQLWQTAVMTGDTGPVREFLIKPFTDAWTGVQNAWANVSTFFGAVGPQILAALSAVPGQIVALFSGVPGQIGTALAAVTEAIKAPFISAIAAVQAAWDALVKSITSFDVGAVLGNIGSKIGKGAQGLASKLTGGLVPAPGTQHGGIFANPQIRQIAEAGPEAVIPLSGNAGRSAGLLGAAASALGMGRGGEGGGMVMNFTPNISIAGGADESVVRTLEERLRAMSRDFMSDWESAYKQQRRLNFG